MSDKPEFLPLDCDKIADKYTVFPISKVQPTYFVAKSFKSSCELFEKYVERMNKPFNVYYDPKHHVIEVDRKLKTFDAKDEGPKF